MTGRPSDYNHEIAAVICSRLVEGESLRSICRDDAMPACSTVFLWLQLHESFSEQYTRAREAQADTLADELLDIADDSANDYMERATKDGSVEKVVDAEHINRSRLRVDTRKWIASKLKPKKYGEKQQVEHSGTLSLEQLIAGSRDPSVR